MNLVTEYGKTSDPHAQYIFHRLTFTFGKDHSLSSRKVEMYLYVVCHVFKLHMNAKKIKYALWLRLRLGDIACSKIKSKSKKCNINDSLV